MIQPVLILVFICLALPQHLFSQTQYFYNIDNSKYPTVKMKYIARDGSGVDNFLNANAYTAEDFTIKENGVDMTPILDCGQKTDTPAVQILFMVNNSVTTDDKPNNCLDWSITGIKAVVDSLYWVTGTKVAVTTFVNETALVSGFTTDTAGLNKLVDKIETTSGVTDYVRPFQSKAYPWTMFDQNTDSNIPRVIVFITNKNEPGRLDNWTTDVTLSLAAECKKRSILFFYVAMVEQPSEILKNVSRQTGGRYYNPTSKATSIIALREIVHQMQKRQYCEISYVSPYACSQARSVEITLVPKDTTVTRSFQAPASSVPGIQLSATTLSFGKPGVDKDNKKIKLTYNGPDMTLQGLTFSTNGLFEVKNLATPKTLTNGSTFDMEVGYTSTPPTEPVTVTATVKSSDFLCQSALPSFTIKADWFDFVYNVEQKVNSVTTDKTVMTGESTTKTISCAIKNLSNAEITVNSSVIDDSDGDFTITSGGGDKTVAVNACLNDLVVKFAPKTAGSGTKTAKINIRVINPADITNTYQISLSGNVVPNSVEDLHPDKGGYKLAVMPNPMAENGRICFTVTDNAFTSLDLYNSLGSHVESIVGENMEAGSYTAEYNSKNLAPGVYFLKLRNGNNTETMRLIISR